MVTCQSSNQLKTPAKVFWAFKIVSRFGSLDYTIMGKTADLTVVQKTIIDTLHKEGKTQTFIAKEAGCSQSAVSKHVNRKLSGRKKCGRKRCTTNRENRSLMRIVIVLVQVGPLCFLKTNVTAPVYQETLEHFMLPSADQLFKDADFICPHCQKHQKLVKWPWCWCAWLASKLTRPEHHWESMKYCQEENEKQETKTCRWAEGHCQRNLGFHTTSAVHTNWSPSCHAELRQ